MNFRDRAEVLEEGEFIVVPHDVEYAPAALDQPCEIVMFEATAGG